MVKDLLGVYVVFTFGFTLREHSMELLGIVSNQELLACSDCSFRENKNI